MLIKIFCLHFALPYIPASNICTVDKTMRKSEKYFSDFLIVLSTVQTLLAGIYGSTKCKQNIFISFIIYDE